MTSYASPDPSSVLNPRKRPAVRLIALFAVVVAVVTIGAFALSCTWQEQMELSLAIGINNLRTERGIAPLTNDPQLSAVARARAEDMATKGYFSHTPPDGCGTRCLIEMAGIAPAWVGEVIAWNTTSVDRSAEMTIGLWRNSSQHYGIITNPCFTRVGTGAVVTSDGQIYHVAVFEGRAPGC